MDLRVFLWIGFSFFFRFSQKRLFGLTWFMIWTAVWLPVVGDVCAFIANKYLILNKTTV